MSAADIALSFTTRGAIPIMLSMGLTGGNDIERCNELGREFGEDSAFVCSNSKSFVFVLGHSFLSWKLIKLFIRDKPELAQTGTCPHDPKYFELGVSSVRCNDSEVRLVAWTVTTCFSNK